MASDIRFRRGENTAAKLICCCLFLLAAALISPSFLRQSSAEPRGPVLVASIEGPITPAKDAFLREVLEEALHKNARLLVVRLNTPGGLITSMQKMVQSLLEAKVPTVVYVSPHGAGAISAGVFITLAGHFAYMAPGTNIGAAHPVTGGGGNIQGDMREKLENYAVSLIKAIAEERGRNMEWAEKAVRESDALTATEAFDKNVIDGLASDLDKLLSVLEGQVVVLDGVPHSLRGLTEAPRENIEMGLRGDLIDFLCNPNVALVLGYAAMLAFTIEFMAPGGFIAGTIGLICLVLSLIAGQSLPINSGGLVLLFMAFVLFVVELMVPAFGFWGIAGIVCLVLGSVYFIDSSMVWSATGFSVDLLFVTVFSTLMLAVFAALAFFVFRTRRVDLNKERDSLVGMKATVVRFFCGVEGSAHVYGKVSLEGRVLSASLRNVEHGAPEPGTLVTIVDIEQSGSSVVVE